MARNNQITIMGNVTDIPELRYTPNGTPLARFRVAETPSIRDASQPSGWRDGQTNFIQCVAWGSLAEHVATNVAKGQRLVVSGRLRVRDYEDTNGNRRWYTEVEADEVGLSLRFGSPRLPSTAAATVSAPPAHHVPEEEGGQLTLSPGSDSEEVQEERPF